MGRIVREGGEELGGVDRLAPARVLAVEQRKQRLDHTLGDELGSALASTCESKE